jgi:hypothetical protein
VLDSMTPSASCIARFWNILLSSSLDNTSSTSCERGTQHARDRQED